jgi:hypothetical protein
MDSAQNDPGLLSGTAPAHRQTSMLHSTGGYGWKPRQMATPPAGQDQAADLLLQLQALTTALPAEEACQPIREPLLQAIRQAAEPVLLAICNDILPAAQADESAGVQAVTLLPHAEDAEVCTESGILPLRALPVLGNFAAPEAALAAAALEEMLLQWRAGLEAGRDRLLLVLPGGIAPPAGGGESAAPLLRRAQMIFWLSAAAHSGAEEGGFLRPVDLFAVALRSLQPASTAPARAGASAPQSAEGISAAPQLIARDLQEKAALLFQDSRLVRMQAALQHSNHSAAARQMRLLHAVRALEAAAQALSTRFSRLASSIRHGLQQARDEHHQLQAVRQLHSSALPLWNERQNGPCDWLGEESEATWAVPEPLRRDLETLRAAFAELHRERRSLQREQARNAEELRYLERRTEELQPTPDAARQLIQSLLGESLAQDPQPEMESIQAQQKQCQAEALQLGEALAALDLRSEKLCEEARQLAARMVQQISSHCEDSASALEARRASLRRTRWELQANAEAIASAAAVARGCAALDEALRGFASAAGTPLVESCLCALRACRHSCEALLELQQTTASARVLRIYRRILAIELQTVAETVHDCRGVLHALDMAFARVPMAELCRALDNFVRRNPSPPGSFALRLCLWLQDGGVAASAALRDSLTALPAAEQALSEVRSFVEHHAPERRDEFLAILLAASPRHKHDVLRRAARSSPAYRQALMMAGADLLAAFASPSSLE